MRATNSRSTSLIVAVVQEAFLFTLAFGLTLESKCQSASMVLPIVSASFLAILGFIELNTFRVISTKLYVVSLFIQPKKPIFLRFVIICFSFLWLALNTICLWLVVAFMRRLDGSNACGLHSQLLITPWGLVGAFSCECKCQKAIQITVFFSLMG